MTKTTTEIKRSYKIYYYKPEFQRDASFSDFHIDPDSIKKTHTHLVDVKADSLDAVYLGMQANMWSPNGEAKELIKSKGLGHTSMSIGDVIYDKTTDTYIRVASVGFEFVK